jgi:uracil phosphoribosyltransferase
VYSDAVPVHIVDHPLVHDALVSLRDKTTPPEAFRRAPYVTVASVDVVLG